MTQSKKHNDHDWVTIGFRTLGKNAALVHKAAEHKGETAAEYMRRALLELAAHDLGVPVPEEATTRIPSLRELVAQAAKDAGVSVKEFQAQAVREVALRNLQRPQQPRQRGAAQSGTHALNLPRKARSG